MDQAAAIDEWVNYNSNGTASRRIWEQMFSMKQFKNFDGNVANDNRIMRAWDFNLDGFAHMGMYPDFVQDIRNTGVTFEQFGAFLPIEIASVHVSIRSSVELMRTHKFA